MLLHRISHSVGSRTRDGKVFHGYRAMCGAPIVAAVPLVERSTIALGPEPHAHCPKCFASEDEHHDVQLPDDPLTGAVYDEKGTRLKAVREREPGMDGPPEQFAPLRQDNGLGQYEHRPYG